VIQENNINGNYQNFVTYYEEQDKTSISPPTDKRYLPEIFKLNEIWKK
jgi:hypothetical protein